MYLKLKYFGIYCISLYSVFLDAGRNFPKMTSFIEGHKFHLPSMIQTSQQKWDLIKIHWLLSDSLAKFDIFTSCMIMYQELVFGDNCLHAKTRKSHCLCYWKSNHPFFNIIFFLVLNSTLYMVGVDTFIVPSREILLTNCQ